MEKPVNSILSEIKNISLVEPLDYENFVDLMSFAYLVLTDSGGIREEAPSLGIRVVMRDETERPEALEAGTVAYRHLKIQSEISKNCSMIKNNTKDVKINQSYGDGKASKEL